MGSEMYSIGRDLGTLKGKNGKEASRSVCVCVWGGFSTGCCSNVPSFHLFMNDPLFLTLCNVLRMASILEHSFCLKVSSAQAVLLFSWVLSLDPACVIDLLAIFILHAYLRSMNPIYTRYSTGPKHAPGNMTWALPPSKTSQLGLGGSCPQVMGPPPTPQTRNRSSTINSQPALGFCGHEELMVWRYRESLPGCRLLEAMHAPVDSLLPMHMQSK